MTRTARPRATTVGGAAVASACAAMPTPAGAEGAPTSKDVAHIFQRTCEACEHYGASI
jgi:hypothetical protein